MKDDSIYLDDVVQFISEVSGKVAGVSKEEFLSDENLQDSIMLKIIHIGEALGRVSSGFRQEHPEFPWHEAIGMRNRVAHDYGNINIEDVWTTATVDLPELLSILEVIQK